MTRQQHNQRKARDGVFRRRTWNRTFTKTHWTFNGKRTVRSSRDLLAMGRLSSSDQVGPGELFIFPMRRCEDRRTVCWH